MKEWFSQIIEISKLPVKVCLFSFLITILLLFLPESLLIKLHLKEFINKYNLYIGITALCSFVLLIIELIIYLWKSRQNSINQDKKKRESLKRIQKLDPAEKAVLREFVLQGQNTIQAPIDNPIITGLLDCGVLEIVGKYGRGMLSGVVWNIKKTDFIQEHLKDEILGIPKCKPTQDEIKFLMENRPSFVKNISKENSLFNINW